MSNDLVITPDWWCTRCGEYRCGEGDGVYGMLCPSCMDDDRRTARRHLVAPSKVDAVTDAIEQMRNGLRHTGLSATVAASNMQSLARGPAMRVLEDEYTPDGVRIIHRVQLYELSFDNDGLPHSSIVAEVNDD